jgi:hypothetical protein
MLRPIMPYHSLILHPHHLSPCYLGLHLHLSTPSQAKGTPERPSHAILQRVTPFLSFPFLISLLPLHCLDEEKYISLSQTPNMKFVGFRIDLARNLIAIKK